MRCFPAFPDPSIEAAEGSRHRIIHPLCPLKSVATSRSRSARVFRALRQRRLPKLTLQGIRASNASPVRELLAWFKVAGDCGVRRARGSIVRGPHRRDHIQGMSFHDFFASVTCQPSSLPGFVG